MTELQGAFISFPFNFAVIFDRDLLGPYRLLPIDWLARFSYPQVRGFIHMTNSMTEAMQDALNVAADQSSDYAKETTDRVTNIGDRIGSRVKKMGKQMRDIEVDEATVPDAFRKVPKLITPKAHGFLDLAVTAYFVGLGIWFAARGKKGAATAAFVNGAMVGGISLFTDYEGDGSKPISFKMHGTLDAVQAATAALAPVLHGFADEPEAKYFWGQAANEGAVIATTDWDAGMPTGKRRNAA
jgi:hypothetical protein